MIVSDMTWTAGSAPSMPASFVGKERLDITIRRGCGREAIAENEARL